MKKKKTTTKMGPTLEELLKANPHLDAAIVRSHREVRKKLRGFDGKSEYRLASPYTQKRVSVSKDYSHRTVTLGRRALA